MLGYWVWGEVFNFSKAIYFWNPDKVKIEATEDNGRDHKLFHHHYFLL